MTEKTETTTAEAEGPSINFEGESILISTLPNELQNLLQIYQRFNHDLEHQKSELEEKINTLRLEVLKHEAAVKAVSTEITFRLKDFKSNAKLNELVKIHAADLSEL